jgi:hypothetical protein
MYSEGERDREHNNSSEERESEKVEIVEDEKNLFL